MVHHHHKIQSQVVVERVAVAMLVHRAMLCKDLTQHSIEMKQKKFVRFFLSLKFQLKNTIIIKSSIIFSWFFRFSNQNNDNTQ